MKGSIIKGVCVGLVVSVVILLLFGLVGKSWLVGVLAGFCCFVGFFCITFAWFYLKAVERSYKGQRGSQDQEREPQDDSSEKE